MKSKRPNFIVGNIGKFEVDAQWQWKLNVKNETVIFLVSFLIIILLVTIGFIYLNIQYYKLQNIQEEVHMELQQFKKLKQEMESVEWLFNDSPIDRKKRENPTRGKRSINKKSSEIKKLKKGKIQDQTRISMPGYVKKLKVRAVHLERNVSYTETANDGIISHWLTQNWVDPVYTLENVVLENNNSSLVIQRTGLYLIYAQLCYAKTRENNSYEVKVMSEGRGHFEPRTIAQCSAGTSSQENEVTCYTSVVQVLQAGDHVYLQQTQKRRHLLMNKGRSFLGIVELGFP